MSLKDRLKEIKGSKLVVTKERIRGCWYINSDRPYQKVLEELQVRLLALDVLENEKQDLTVVLNTKHAGKLIKDTIELCNIIRCKIVRV